VSAVPGERRDRVTPPPGGPPILVTGAPRSGSTWVGNVLALDGGSGVIYEPFNKRNPAGRCRARFEHAFTYVTPETENPYLAPLRDTLAWRYSLGAELRALGGPRALLRMARDLAYFEAMRRRHARVILKDPIAIFSADWIARRFGAQVVVVIRHPAGFVASLRAAGWQRVRFEIFADQPQLVEDRLAPYRDEIAAAVRQRPDPVAAGTLLWKLLHHHIARLRDEHPDWVFVRHEDLSRAPVPAFRELFGRLGLDFTEGVQRDLERFTGGGTALSLFGAKRRTMRSSQDSVAAFRNRLTPQEISRIRAAAGPLADRFYGEADW
jgi:hypothetical protein